MKITSPDSPALTELCNQLAERADQTDASGRFPYEQIKLCGEAGVFEWFLDPAWGGQGWSDADVVRGYYALSRACLTTTFVITQRTGACRRIATSDNDQLKQSLLPKLASGESFSTVGISHLTTSGRHLAQPLLTAEVVEGGFRLNGVAPWVTGGEAADHLVLGVSITRDNHPTDEEALVVVPKDLPGLRIAKPFDLVGVSGSSTGPVELNDAMLGNEYLIAGPVRSVMQSGFGGRTGGYETSTLALGLSAAALDFLRGEAEKRKDLRPAFEKLSVDHQYLLDNLLSLVHGEPNCTTEALRSGANSLALRMSQAALSAAKGRGYVSGHPVGRWCREALFFMVWSCPQPVANANLCELAGIV